MSQKNSFAKKVVASAISFMFLGTYGLANANSTNSIDKNKAQEGAKSQVITLKSNEKTEAPKTEAPKAEAPKAEAPKAEAPKAEAPKAEAPKAEAPKAEAPKAEAPKAEAPKAEAPKAEAPKAEAPKAETNKLPKDGNNNTSLQIYNRVNNIWNGLLPSFEAQSAYKIVHEEYKEDSTLYSSNSDLIVLSSEKAAEYVKNGAFQKLEKSKLFNFKNLNSVILDKMSKIDPKNEYLLPWSWDYVSVGINKTLVSASLGDLPFPDNAWELLFDKKYTSKLKSCGIMIASTPNQFVAAGVHYKGSLAYNPDKLALDAVSLMFNEIKSDYIGASTNVLDDLAGRRACVVFSKASDIRNAKERMKDAGEKDDILVLLPKNGAFLVIDSIAIRKDSKNIVPAYDFLNYYLRPNIAAQQGDSIGRLAGNVRAIPYLSDSVLKNKTLVLSEEDLRKMIAPQDVSKELNETMKKLYNDFVN